MIFSTAWWLVSFAASVSGQNPQSGLRVVCESGPISYHPIITTPNNTVHSNPNPVVRGKKVPRRKIGLRGPKGLRRKIGLRGPKGLRGKKGPKGEKGDRGEQGLVGVQGLKGLEGEKGEKGLKGQVGVKGDKGESNRREI